MWYISAVFVALLAVVMSDPNDACHLHRLDVLVDKGDHVLPCISNDNHVMVYNGKLMIHKMDGDKIEEVDGVCGVTMECKDMTPRFCYEGRCYKDDKDCDFAIVKVKGTAPPIVECQVLEDLYGQWGQRLEESHGHGRHGH